jgi:hypothetical protein
MFKPDPKKQVVLKFVELFGKDFDLQVRGTRDTGPRSTYLTEVVVNDAVVAFARHRDWRTSYRLLKQEVEKLYTDGIALI